MRCSVRKLPPLITCPVSNVAWIIVDAIVGIIVIVNAGDASVTGVTVSIVVAVEITDIVFFVGMTVAGNVEILVDVGTAIAVILIRKAFALQQAAIDIRAMPVTITLNSFLRERGGG